jgi:hypothetical protein
MEYLDVWASSKIFFLRASLLGTTSLSLNHRVPFASPQKQATFGSPFAHSPLDMTHAFVILLSGYDLSLQGWHEGDVEQG